MSYQPTTLESRRIMTETIKTLLQPIQNRLNAATDASPVPWEAVGTGVRGGDHWYVCAEGQSIASIACNDGENEEQREPLARFLSAAPTDQARLLAAVQAVEEWCLNLDAVEKVNPSSSDNLNASAGAIANVLRKSVAAALTEAR